jgi:uncharacterized protein
MQAVDRDETGMGLAFGSPQEGRAWIGRRSEPQEAEAPLSEAMIGNYCALVEDGNPAYWEQGSCPPGLLMTLGFPFPWRPGRERRPPLFAVRVPLPGRHLINVSTETEFHRAVQVGERPTFVEEVVDVSEEKETRLGPGQFVTTRTTFSVDGETAAVNINVLLRYDPPEAG